MLADITMSMRMFQSLFGYLNSVANTKGKLYFPYTVRNSKCISKIIKHNSAKLNSYS